MRRTSCAWTPVAVLLCVALAAANCGGGGTAANDDATSLLFGTRDGTIVEFNLSSNTSRLLASFPAEENIAAREPAASPDNTRLVYIGALPLHVLDAKEDVSSDLWIANRDGSGARILYEHRQRNETLFSPQWEDGDHVLVVARTAPDRRSLAGVTFRLLRVNANDGSAETAMDEVNAFGVDRDGHVAFARIRIVPGFTEETLNAGRMDGSDLTVLLPNDQELAFFGAPRFSPDGKRIAFIALQRTLVFTPKAPSENAPAELWIMDADGTDLTQVIEFDAREGSPPGLAWAPDGKHIFVAGEAGVFNVDLELGFAEKLGTERATGTVVLAGSAQTD
jgi:Tol biopolymer transport system component